MNDAFHETLVFLDNDTKNFTYKIDDGPVAVFKDIVDAYIEDVTLFSITENDTAFMVWTSRWESTKEGGVAAFFHPIYHALLQNLKNHFS